ncbi:hypothetical protein I4F81_004140 [Pyropia yezoensis]|uniref:Uncharacterized protein n=1 Tax=Pyropia yezoensis TaxID=2788 RepID=A0ACC3BU44_PYRYE|nr:hypothetical protein I4F81_004140 [Neopyropia yezoensis]
MARQRRPEAVAVLAVCLLVAVPAVAAAVATAAAGVSPLPPAVVWRQLPAGARGSGAYPLGRQGVPVVTPTPPPGNAAAAAAAARGCVGLFASTGSGNAQASSGESAPYLCAITATVTTAADITSCGVVVSEELTWPWTTGRPAVRVVDYRDVEGVSVTALTFTPDGVEQLSVRRLAPSTSRRCGNQTAVSWPTCATRACDYRYVACREGDDDDGDPWYKNLPEWLIPAAIVLTLCDLAGDWHRRPLQTVC